jgi:hypothetical protein
MNAGAPPSSRTALWGAIVVVALAGSVFVASFYVPPEYGLQVSQFLKTRTALALFLTLLMLIFTLQNYWRLRTSPKFWVMLLAFLIVVATSLFLVPYAPAQKYVLLSIICGSEFAFFALLLYRVFGIAPQNRRNKVKD